MPGFPLQPWEGGGGWWVKGQEQPRLLGSLLCCDSTPGRLGSPFSLGSSARTPGFLFQHWERSGVLWVGWGIGRLDTWVLYLPLTAAASVSPLWVRWQEGRGPWVQVGTDPVLPLQPR